jgi:hypothetical protein
MLWQLSLTAGLCGGLGVLALGLSAWDIDLDFGHFSPHSIPLPAGEMELRC